MFVLEFTIAFPGLFKFVEILMQQGLFIPLV